MTEPIKIPLLNTKLDAEGNQVPITHADLPPAPGIANTITVHEHVTVLQSLKNELDALILKHETLKAEHEALKAERSDPSNTATDTTAEGKTPVIEASTEVVTSEDSIPASKPVTFTPKVPIASAPSEVKE